MSPKVHPSFLKQEKPLQATFIRKRIGSTTYLVAVHLSKTAKETVNDKVLRLVRSEVMSDS